MDRSMDISMGISMDILMDISMGISMDISIPGLGFVSIYGSAWLVLASGLLVLVLGSALAW